MSSNVVPPEDPAFYARLEVAKVLDRYDVPLLWLAKDPAAGESEFGDWLISWRKGGTLGSSVKIPVELAGIETWVALPISHLRKKQILAEHVSLRETILFAEKGLYLLEGVDPSQPTKVEVVNPYLVPNGLLPLADISVLGNEVKHPPLTPKVGGIPILLHFVPSEKSPDNPSIGIAGPLGGGVQRFISWSARSIAKEDPVDSGIPIDDWAGFTPVAAEPGTLSLVIEGTTVNSGRRQAVLGAAGVLTQAGRLALDESGYETLLRQIGPEGLVALAHLFELVSASKVSVSIKWFDGGKERFAALGEQNAGDVARHLQDRLSSTELARVNQTKITIQLSAEEVSNLRKTVDPRAGGHQWLIAQLQEHIHKDNTLDLEPEQAARVIRYVQDYGMGGYQDRLRPIYVALYRAGLSFASIR
jgi:hypothetical protein